MKLNRKRRDKDSEVERKRSDVRVAVVEEKHALVSSPPIKQEVKNNLPDPSSASEVKNASNI